MLRDVLVFTPVLRLEPETVTGIFAMEWDGPLSILYQRDNPVTGDGLRAAGYQNHLHQYQRGRELFLCGGYDALLVIESDIIPPPDTLTRLAVLPADIAYGAYMFREGRVVNVLERYKPWPRQARNMGESLSVRGLWQSAVSQGVIDCSGSGFGCVLIQRHVIEAMPFEPAVEGGFFDWQWTQAVYSAGYRMMADTAVQCGHKDTTGEVLWPS